MEQTAAQHFPLDNATGLAAVAGVAACGAGVLYAAMFPDLYYMAWIVVIPAFWSVAAMVWVARSLVLAAFERPHGVLVDRWALALFVVWILITQAFWTQLPMRVAFWLTLPTLQTRLAESPTRPPGTIGPYTFDLGPVADYCGTPGIAIYPLIDAGDMAAFVHAPGGIDALCYNDGAKGRLFGDWYWKVDD